MKALQPKMTELREKYADDKQQMQKELMGMYRREKVNPVSGCLPIVLQIPVFFALYKVSVRLHRDAPRPLLRLGHGICPQPDPLNLFTLFGAVPWDPPPFAWPSASGRSSWA